MIHNEMMDDSLIYIDGDASRIEQALKSLSEGLNLRHSLKQSNLTPEKFFKALEQSEELRIQYNSIVEAQTHNLADQLLEIPDKYDDVQRAKLKSDNIKWLISRRNRKAYGDKLEVDHNHNVDIRAALDSATARLKEVEEIDSDKISNDSSDLIE